MSPALQHSTWEASEGRWSCRSNRNFPADADVEHISTHALLKRAIRSCAVDGVVDAVQAMCTITKPTSERYLKNSQSKHAVPERLVEAVCNDSHLPVNQRAVPEVDFS